MWSSVGLTDVATLRFRPNGDLANGVTGVKASVRKWFSMGWQWLSKLNKHDELTEPSGNNPRKGKMLADVMNAPQSTCQSVRRGRAQNYKALGFSLDSRETRSASKQLTRCNLNAPFANPTAADGADQVDEVAFVVFAVAPGMVRADGHSRADRRG